MAKKKRNIHLRMHVVSEEHTMHVLYDQQGEPVLRLGEIVREGESNGREITETVTEYVKTPSGDILSGSSLMPRRGQSGSRACAACERRTWLSLFRRGQPKITFAPATEMKRCYHCGANLCPKHYRSSRSDGQARCRWRCHIWHRLYTWTRDKIVYIQKSD